MAQWDIEKEIIMQRLLSINDTEKMEQIHKISQDFDVLMSYYRCAMMEIETKFKVLNEEFSTQYDRNPISAIKTRLKEPRSIKEKMERKGLSITPDTIWENLNDIAGVRVICSFPEDVYALSEALLKQDDVTLIEKKDYIQNPKANGYRSLHIIVEISIFLAHVKRPMRVEIQLRTIAMDCWASLEHQMRYKKDFVFTDEMANELLACAELSANLDMRMGDLWKKVQGTEKIGN